MVSGERDRAALAELQHRAVGVEGEEDRHRRALDVGAGVAVGADVAATGGVGEAVSGDGADEEASGLAAPAEASSTDGAAHAASATSAAVAIARTDRLISQETYRRVFAAASRPSRAAVSLLTLSRLTKRSESARGPNRAVLDDRLPSSHELLTARLNANRTLTFF